MRALEEMTTSHASVAPGPRGYEPDLIGLRTLAEDLARGHTHRTTTGHLLAAIASGSSGAADLLRERRLDTEVLLKAARVTTDDTSDSVTQTIQRARDFANRSLAPGAKSGGPGAAHLLFVLCQEPASGAYRALEQCGADVAKLRTAAMQLALGPGLLRGEPVAAPPSQTPSPRPATGALRQAVRLLRAMDGDELARAIRVLGALRARRLRPQGRHRATKKSSPLSRA